MTEFSQFHYEGKGIHYPATPFGDGSGTWPEREMIKLAIEYRGFVLRRGDPNAGWLWSIYSKADREVPGLTGRFTKLDLAKAEVDKYFETIERQQIELGMRANETKHDHNQTR